MAKRNSTPKYQQPEKKKPNKIDLHKIKEQIYDLILNPNWSNYILISIIWIYILFRLIITDVDLLFATKYLKVDAFNYAIIRLIAVTVFTLSLWIKFGNKRYFIFIFRFLLFPIYPFFFFLLQMAFWSIPALLIKKKSYFFLYTYLESIISIFIKLKYNLLKIVMFVLSFIIIVNYQGKILIPAIIILGILQIMHLTRRYKEINAPFKVLHLKVDFIDLVDNMPPLAKGKKSIKKKKVKKNLKKNLEEFEYYMLFFEFLSVFKQEITNIFSGSTYSRGFVFKALYSILLTVLLFAGINYGLFKIDDTSFIYSGVPEFFEFLNYSFFSILPDGSDISASSRLAKTIRMCGVLIGVLINILIIGVLFTVKSNRYKENLSILSKFTHEYSKDISQFLKSKYGKNPVSGLKMLKESGSEISNYIEQFRSYFKK